MDANCMTLTTGETTGGDNVTYYGETNGVGVTYTITPSVYWWYLPTWYPYTVEPQVCIGKAHVFECAHERHCKCGAVERVMAKPLRRR